MTGASVVVRAKDEAASIGRTLDLVREQSVDAQLIVVDSGSRDATCKIARERGAELIEIPPEAFTFGGALNTGCDAATAGVVVALSAHAYLPDRDWLARLVAEFDDPRVACVCGSGSGPDGGPLRGRVVQDRALAERFPYWGFTNAAGGFRRELWAERDFRDDMPGTEDKEWASYWLARGKLAVFRADLLVDHDHSKDPLRALYDRGRREWIGYGMYLDVPPLPLREALRNVAEECRHKRYRSPLNMARVAALVAGERAGRRARPS